MFSSPQPIKLQSTTNYTVWLFDLANYRCSPNLPTYSNNETIALSFNNPVLRRWLMRRERCFEEEAKYKTATNIEANAKHCLYGANKLVRTI